MGSQIDETSSQRGQGLVEAVLLLAVTASLSVLIVSKLQQGRFLQNIMAQPWAMLSGMIECGVWSGCGPGLHPASRNRNLSLDPRGG